LLTLTRPLGLKTWPTAKSSKYSSIIVSTAPASRWREYIGGVRCRAGKCQSAAFSFSLRCGYHQPPRSGMGR
jgi:hypothetical protein